MTSQALNRPVDVLAQEIRRVDGNHSLGAGALAEALMPFLDREFIRRAAVAELADAVGHWCALMPGLAGGPEFDRMRAALAAVEGQP